MTSDADAWLERELAGVREAVRQHPPTGRDLTLEQYEQRVRGWVATHLQPTEPYVGLTVPEAQERAVGEHRVVAVREGSGRRSDFMWHRVNVWLDADGRVVRARTDRSPWTIPRAGPEPAVPVRVVDPRTAAAGWPVLDVLKAHQAGAASLEDVRSAVQRAPTGVDPELTRVLDQLTGELAAASGSEPGAHAAVDRAVLSLRSVVNDA